LKDRKISDLKLKIIEMSTEDKYYQSPEVGQAVFDFRQRTVKLIEETLEKAPEPEKPMDGQLEIPDIDTLKVMYGLGPLKR
jgi:hypothetical protein